VADQLGHREREQRAEPSRSDAVAPVPAAVLPAGEEEHGQQRDEDDLAVDREEAKEVLEPVVMGGVVVQPLIDAQVQGHVAEP
jgi:hypothetical protein